MAEKLISIGKITAPHGVRGEVRVIPDTDFPERFEQMKTIRLDDGSVWPVLGVKYHKHFVLLTLKGIDSKNAAEPLRNKVIQVRPDELMPLPAGHYYHFQIIGLEVFTEDGEFLGQVKDIITTGSNDVYVVEQEGQRPVLVPALKKVVLDIDLPGGKMKVKLQEWEAEA